MSKKTLRKSRSKNSIEETLRDKDSELADAKGAKEEADKTVLNLKEELESIKFKSGWDKGKEYEFSRPFVATVVLVEKENFFKKDLDIIGDTFEVHTAIKPHSLIQLKRSYGKMIIPALNSRQYDGLLLFICGEGHSFDNSVQQMHESLVSDLPYSCT